MSEIRHGDRVPRGERLRYIALGDSYTIGTAVPAADAFPAQLERVEPRLELVANLGVNGYSTVDLIREELPVFQRSNAEFATLLVGANDVVQGIGSSTFEANVERIIAVLLGHLPVDRIVTVSVPDYTVTPAGGDYGDPVERSAGIRARNATMERIAAEHGIAFVDIHDLSLEAATDRSLVADDGLHPSAAQYARWVERIAPVVRSLLDAGEGA
jgi:lysophospholipase L1-like esterase